MGDIGAAETNNGVVMEGRLGFTNPDPSVISDDQWAIAEETTQEVLDYVHPTLDSEEKRKDVLDYVQRLIRCSVGFEVFPYGSVPLKTYLPDGDIDLTVLYNPCAEESWASEVLSVLQGEEQNENAEYEVKDTQFIDAEVKLVKCLIQNIVIDISFNQMGGLCTLCFLEQVDRLVGKDHLFKRSIILIKAWCYYESRILGAHHGLISTYALETLVLYIFHLFHSSLKGPLAVLYRFLDYFSKFDWENYCISLSGPVCKSSLPNIVVEMPKNEGHDLLLTEEFLRNCMEMFSVPSRCSETSSRCFLTKHLNIIDPLKEYNNLGRSVHRGNFYRIRSAFKHGACKLGHILPLPREDIADEIKKFFSNTLQCHERKDTPGIQDYALVYGGEGLGMYDPFSPVEAFSEDDMLLRSPIADFENDGLGDSIKVVSSQMTSECSYSLDDHTVSGHHSNGDEYDLATYSSADFRTSNGTSECSASSNYSGSFFGQDCHAPQLPLSKTSTENGHFIQSDPSDNVEEKLPCLESRMNDLEIVKTYQSCEDNCDSFCSCSSAVSSPKTSVLESLSLDFRDRDSSSVVDAEPLNPLADLGGDYDSHIRSLLYGQCCLGFALSVPTLSSSPVSPSQFQCKKAWETSRNNFRPFRSNSFSHVNSRAWEPPTQIAPSYPVFASEEKHKGRGTGTYLPITNSFSRDRHSQGKIRNKTSGTYGQHRQTHSRSVEPTFEETNASGKGSPEVFNALGLVQIHKKSGATCQSYHHKEGDAHANGCYYNSSFKIQFGSLGHMVDDVTSRSSVIGGSSSTASPDEPTSVSDSSKGEERRVSHQSFLLKSDDEFPPLSL